jgi:glycosyltransferase involved in cell wall biosynthesis/uncharacterized coiled-coil protein SlyX
MPPAEPLTIVHYAADVWEHVCPVVRLTGPVELAGWRLVRGNEWENGVSRIFPERVSEGNVVVIQRDFPRHAQEYQAVVAQARAQGKLLVYELDDLLTEIPETHPDVLRYRTARAHVLNAMIQADVVTCATPGLRDYIRQFNPNVWVLPNYLNDRLWTLRSSEALTEPAADRPLVIGYLGAPSHKPDLELVLPALESVLERYQDRVLFRLWGMALPRSLARRANVEVLNPGLVDYAQFAAYFGQQEYDICIAPMQDNLFNRCKSWIKFIEYAACGAAGVYSRLPPYEQVVRHRQNGLLASSPEEWQACLTELIEHPDERSRLGRAAQATLRQDWLLSDHIQEWAGVFAELVSASGERQKFGNEQLITNKFYLWHLDDEEEILSLRTRVEADEKIMRELEENLAEKESQIRALNKEVSVQAQNLDKLHAEITSIFNSPGWKMLELVYKVRLFLIPRNSLRERLLRAMVQSLRILKNEGPRALARRLPLLWRATGPGSLPAEVGLTPQVFLGQPAGRCPTPAISVIVAEGAARRSPEAAAVIRWVQGQTLRAVEVVRWDQQAAEVMDCTGATASGRRWQAPDLAGLRQGLGGRYVCWASEDLLDQDETYLETNLVALESEGLAFTVNAWGKADALTQALRQGRLPGGPETPLLRQVVRKEHLNDDFSVSVEARLAGSEGAPAVLGKVIVHTTSRAETAAVLRFGATFGEPPLRVEGRRILAPHAEGVLGTASAPVYPVEAVMPLAAEPSPQPTVLVVMPFLAVGGAEQLALHILNSLKENIRFVILSVDELDPALGTLSDAFRQLTPWVYNTPDFLDPQLRPGFLWYLIERFRPDTLYIANGAGWIYDILPELKRRYPELRTVNQVYDSQAGWINRYDVSLVLNMDAHIGANQRICQAYLEKGARPEQVYLVEHGIDPTELDPHAYSPKDRLAVRRKLGLPETGRVVTFASRIHPQKRPVDFLELARRFSAEPGIAFLMAGDGPLSGLLDGLATKMALKNFYRRPFYRPIQDILAISDVVVLPSEYEGMPLIVAEAQVMGKPVVVTDVGNNREVLAITQGGVVISQIGNIDELAAGVRQMLASPPDPARIREALLAHFGIDIISEKYRKVLLGEASA